jgi:hypothetical protein
MNDWKTVGLMKLMIKDEFDELRDQVSTTESIVMDRVNDLLDKTECEKEVYNGRL